MDALSQLHSCLTAAASEKATERKKQIESLRLQLARPLTQKALDNNHGKNDRLKWDNVVKQVGHVISLELETLQKAKPSESAASRASHQKKLAQVGNLYRTVVQHADARGPQLNPRQVVRHIVNKLEEPFARGVLGGEYLDILNKYIFTQQAYLPQISQELYQQILTSCIKLYEKKDKIKRILVSEVIRCTVLQASRYTDINLTTLINFFKQTFTDCRSEPWPVLQNMVRAMNLVCCQRLTESRVQIAALGEAVHGSMLWLWAKFGTQLKDCLVEFWGYQMTVHHPGGSKDPEHGAFAVDWTVWKNQLNKLYAALYSDLQQVSGRSKFGTHQNLIISDAYIRLCADVCHQVLTTEGTSVLEITQLVDVDSTQPRSKRQRLESGWEVIRELVCPQTVAQSVIPWIELVNCICSRYADSVPGDEVGRLLTGIQHQLQHPKIAEVTSCYLHCLETMVTNWSLISPNLDGFHSNHCHVAWQRIVPLSLRLIGLHHAAGPAYQLMTSLERSELVEVDTLWWKTFNGPITDTGIDYLTCLLQRHDIPQTLDQSVGGLQTHPFRNELFDWLLPDLGDKLDETGNLIGLSDVDPFKMAAALVTITFRDPPSMEQKKTVIDELFPEPETFLLHCSFDERNVTFKLDDLDPDDAEGQGRGQGQQRHVASLVKRLETVVLRDCKFFMELQEYNPNLVRRLLYQCALVIGCTYQLAYYDVIPRATNPSSPWVDMIKSLLKKVEKHLLPLLSGDSTTVCELLVLWSALYKLQTLTSRSTVTSSRDVACRDWLAQVLVQGTTQTTLEKLKNLAQSQEPVRSASLFETPSSSRTDSTSRVSSRVTSRDDTDDIDLEFDFDKDDVMMSDATDFPEEVEQTASMEDLQERFSLSCLSDHEKIQVSAVRALCTFARLAPATPRGPLAPQGSPGGSQGARGPSWREKLSETKIFVLEMIDDDDVDYNKVVNLQMAECISSELLQEAPPFLSDDDIISLTDAIKLMCKFHRKDGEICYAAVTIATKLIPHLGDQNGCHDDRPGSHGDGGGDGVSDSIRESREVLMHILTMLWKLQLPQEGTCESLSFGVRTRTAILNCIQTLVQFDPAQTWSLWSEKADRPDNLGRTSQDSLLLGLADPSHAIRTFTATHIVRWLFVREKAGRLYPLEKDVQTDIFKKLYQHMREAMKVETDLGPLAQRDECVNRASCVLRLLHTTVLHSAVCRKKATFVFFLLVKEYNIDQALVVKVMTQVSGLLGFPSLTDYVSDHVAYIVDKWLNLKYPIWDFPFVILGCDDRQTFYRTYQETLVPLLVVHDQVEAVSVMADLLSLDLPALLLHNLTALLTHLLPHLAVTSQSQAVTSRTERAQKHYDWMEQILTKQAVEESTSDRLEDLVVRILRSLQIQHGGEDGGSDVISVPEMNPPFYTAGVVTAALEYLVRGQQGRIRSLIALLAKSQSGLQKVLLSLKTDVYRATSQRIYSWYHSLHVYGLFVRMALQDVNCLEDRWPYLLRDCIYTLIHCMRRLLQTNLSLYSGVVSACFCHCVALLGHVIETSLSQRTLLLPEFLPVIVDTLVDAVNQRACKKCVDLLDLLICRHGDALRSGITLLDPLPWQQSTSSPWKQGRTSEFRDELVKLRRLQDRYKYEQKEWNLEKELVHFLLVGEQRSEQSHRMEGLNFLSHVLAARKDELLQLQQKCSESRDGSVLARVVCVLLNMLKTAHRRYEGEKRRKEARDEEKVIELCCRCLGEIGPVDLCVIAVSEPSQSPHRSIPLQYYLQQKNTAMARNLQILHALDSCLLSDCIDTVRAANDVIRTILTGSEGVTSFLTYRKDVISRDWSHSMVQYLQHFLAEKKRALSTPAPGSCTLSDLSESRVWCSTGVSHQFWIRHLASTIIQSGYVRDSVLNALLPVCSNKSEFSALVLPYLIHDLVLREDDNLTSLLSTRIRHFFSSHCYIAERENSRATTPSSDTDKEESVCGDRNSIDTLLNVVHYLRQQSKPKRGRNVQTVWENNFWLDLDYLDLARAAQYCGRHFTAVLYAEIWCDIQRSADAEEEELSCSQSSIHQLSSMNDESRATVMSILLESYKAIGDPDGVYGCDVSRMADPMVRIKTYEHESRWDKALSGYDLQMEGDADGVPRLSTQLGLLNALNQCGLSHTLSTYMQGLTTRGQAADSDILAVQYQAALKCGTWDLHVPTRTSSRPEYHQSVYGAMTSLRDKDLRLFKQHLSSARLSCVDRLGSYHLLSSNRVYKLLSGLLTLGHIEDAGHVITGSLDVTSLLSKWSDQSRTLRHTDHLYTEPVYDTRVTLLQVLHSVTVQGGDVKEGLMNQIQEQTRLATQAARYQTAARAIRELNQLVSGELQSGTHTQALSAVRHGASMDEARMYWCRGETNTALAMMAAAIKRAKLAMSSDVAIKRKYAEMLGVQGEWMAQTYADSPNIIMNEYLDKVGNVIGSWGDVTTSTIYVAIKRKYAEILGVQGERMAQTYADSPNIIMDEYLDKSVVLLEGCGESSDEACVHAYSALARYADTQYQHIKDYTNSSLYENKVALTRKAKQEVVRLGDIRAKGGDAARYVKLLEKQARLDESEMRAMLQDQCRYLLKAVQSYIRCLEYSSLHDLRIFRLISLWFDNSDKADVNSLLKDAISNIASHKFLPMMYQLAARMSVQCAASQKPFQHLLNVLMSRCCTDHPHHSLNIVMALAHGNLDQEFMCQPGTNKRIKEKKATEESKEDRAVAASKLLTSLRSGPRGDVIDQMERLSRAYIELANMAADKYKAMQKAIKLPSTLKITQIKNLNSVAVPTDTVKVDPSCRYTDVVPLHAFEQTFSLAGGINLPKIIACIGADGIKRKQLVKGKDDLRQDAVMQQVFGMVNTLLDKDTDARRRHLKIRTYKIIPLSQRSGILEWCEGTQPLGEYLVGCGREVQGAHARYRPDDWPPVQCRNLIKEVAGKSNEEKLDAYQEICRRFKPVLRHFFLENFPDPAVWYERRLAYTRSVATNSIVGYILGLGDRHVQNILIDTKSAELVHIDLGVAFEQGKLLPTPETVPFRLTRDIVDGMGVTGVEGVFRRCCEKTMVVMRDAQEVLLTILEVLLYDPLYSWSMSPLKMYLIQHRKDKPDGEDGQLHNTTAIIDGQDSAGGTDSNKTAERVLLRLRQKLQGVETGQHMNVSGQVNMLIQEAMDPNNLCKLFSGWQPYL